MASRVAKRGLFPQARTIWVFLLLMIFFELWKWHRVCHKGDNPQLGARTIQVPVVDDFEL
jgi:hypothetical protein